MKPKFLLWLDGGEGCDYGIGCGTKIITLNSQTFEEARAESEKKYEDFNPDHIDFARLISVVDIIDLDFAGWKRRKEQDNENEINKQNAEWERKEYERLRMKFDPTRSNL